MTKADLVATIPTFFSPSNVLALPIQQEIDIPNLDLSKIFHSSLGDFLTYSPNKEFIKEKLSRHFKIVSGFSGKFFLSYAGFSLAWDNLYRSDLKLVHTLPIFFTIQAVYSASYALFYVARDIFAYSNYQRAEALAKESSSIPKFTALQLQSAFDSNGALNEFNHTTYNNQTELTTHYHVKKFTVNTIDDINKVFQREGHAAAIVEFAFHGTSERLQLSDHQPDVSPTCITKHTVKLINFSVLPKGSVLVFRACNAGEDRADHELNIAEEIILATDPNQEITLYCQTDEHNSLDCKLVDAENRTYEFRTWYCRNQTIKLTHKIAQENAIRKKNLR